MFSGTPSPIIDECLDRGFVRVSVGDIMPEEVLARCAGGALSCCEGSMAAEASSDDAATELKMSFSRLLEES